MKPTTRSAWRAALAAAHPDVGGDPAVFCQLVEERRRWREQHGQCATCGRAFAKYRPQTRFCSLHCKNRATTQRPIRPRRLKGSVEAKRAATMRVLSWFTIRGVLKTTAVRVFVAAVLSLLVSAVPVSANPLVRLAAIVVNFEGYEPAPSGTMDWVREDMTCSDGFYGQQSYAQFATQSDVFGIYTVPLTSTATRQQVAAAAQQAAIAAGVDLTPYGSHLVYISPTGNFGGGYGDLSGVWIARWPSYPFRPFCGTVAHELAHHLYGLPHAHDIRCTDGPFSGTCQTFDDGDALDVMGQGEDDFNAILKWRINWLTAIGAYRMQTAESSGVYIISPLDSATPGTKGLIVSSQSNKWWAQRTYVLEYRRRSGPADKGIPPPGVAALANGITVHLLSVAPIKESTLVYMVPNGIALPVGQTHCFADGRVSFTPLLVDTNGIHVRVDFGHCK